MSVNMFFCSFSSQKYEKPKFIQCLAFLSTGDILTGDSGGVLLVWTRSSTETPGKGPRGEERQPHMLTAPKIPGLPAASTAIG